MKTNPLAQTKAASFYDGVHHKRYSGWLDQAPKTASSFRKRVINSMCLFAKIKKKAIFDTYKCVLQQESI